MSSWLAMLQDAAEMFVFLAVELSLLFIVISAGVSLIRQKVPDHKIQQMMGARKGKGYLLAALLGAVTPFCSCSTIPMLRGLLSAKAGFGPTLTFLFVSPLLNPIIVGLMWVTFGWKVTLLYAKWHLNRSQFGIRIDHDLASISDHSLASQSITIWHASDH